MRFHVLCIIYANSRERWDSSVLLLVFNSGEPRSVSATGCTKGWKLEKRYGHLDTFLLPEGSWASVSWHQLFSNILPTWCFWPSGVENPRQVGGGGGCQWASDTRWQDSDHSQQQYEEAPLPLVKQWLTHWRKAAVMKLQPWKTAPLMNPSHPAALPNVHNPWHELTIYHIQTFLGRFRSQQSGEIGDWVWVESHHVSDPT